MKTVEVRSHYHPPWKLLPVRVMSGTQAAFGEEGLVTFDFGQRRVLFENTKTKMTVELAKLETEAETVSSLERYSGRIVGEGFEISIHRSWFLGNLDLTVKSFVGGVIKESVVSRIHLPTEFDFFNCISCHFTGNETLKVTFEPSYENMARVVSAVLLLDSTFSRPHTG